MAKHTINNNRITMPEETPRQKERINFLMMMNREHLPTVTARGKRRGPPARRLFLVRLAFFFAAPAPLLSGCPSPPLARGAAPYYITGTREQREMFSALFSLLGEEKEAGPERFAVILEIAGEYGRIKDYGRLINFLDAQIKENPGDPYTAWYLLMIASAYSAEDAPAAAAVYFDLIVKNYPDLQVHGESVHFIALKRLITLVDNPARLVWYYEELLAHFSEKIDPGEIYFLLGQAYERIGDWNAAIAAYSRFLPWYGTVIQGFPDAYTYAKQLVDFNNSPKDWTFESLAALVSAIKDALQTGNDWRLWSYRAKVNFFDRSWGQEEDRIDGFAGFDLSSFMRGNQIRFAEELDESSNASEAWLRTWGWSLSITTWYLYFRKINFPLNPEIHGRWEWAGVYYGEKW